MTIHTYGDFIRACADLEAMQFTIDNLHDLRCDCLSRAKIHHNVSDEFKATAARLMDVISDAGFEMSDLRDAVAQFEDAA